MTFELNGGAWLFLALWLAVILTLWNFYSANKFTSRNKMIALSVVVSFLLFFVYLRIVAPGLRKSWERTESVAIFAPLYQDSSGQHRLETKSLMIVDKVIHLLGDKNFPEGNLLTPEQTYAPFHPDSLETPGFAKKLAANFRFSVVSTIAEKKDEAVFSYSIYGLNQEAPLVQARFTFQADNIDEAARIFADRLALFWQIERIENNASAAQNRKASEIRLARIRKNYQHAQALAAAWLAQDSTNIEALKFSIETHFRRPTFHSLTQQQHEQHIGGATREFARLSEQDTTNFQFARLAAEGFYWLEKFNHAAYYTLRAYALDPCNGDMLMLLARLHFSRYRPLGFENESGIYRKALRCNPAAVNAVVGLASASLQKNDSRAGQRLLELYTQKFPGNVTLLSALGEIYVSRGLMREMFETYDAILKYDPGYIEAFYNLGIYYFNSEKYDMAKRFFNKAVSQGKHKNSLLYLARIAQKEDRIDEAISYLRQRIAAKSGDNDAFAESARRQLFEIMVSRGKIDSVGKIIE